MRNLLWTPSNLTPDRNCPWTQRLRMPSWYFQALSQRRPYEQREKVWTVSYLWYKASSQDSRPNKMGERRKSKGRQYWDLDELSIIFSSLIGFVHPSVGPSVRRSHFLTANLALGSPVIIRRVLRGKQCLPCFLLQDASPVIFTFIHPVKSEAFWMCPYHDQVERHKRQRRVRRESRPTKWKRRLRRDGIWERNK